MFFRHVRVDHLSIVNEEAGLALNKFPEASIGTGDFGNEAIENQQGTGSDDAAGQRRVRTGHGVLYGVADQQQ